MRDVYPPTHWAVRGAPPAYDTPDEDVYLAGRNLVLLAKAGVLCAQRQLGRVALGPLAGNPFPDATPDFFAAMGRALSLGLAHDIEIATPLATMHKEDVIRLGAALGVPFELTLSCMNPRADTTAASAASAVNGTTASSPRGSPTPPPTWRRRRGRLSPRFTGAGARNLPTIS